MTTGVLSPTELAGVDLIKRQMAELGFPVWNTSSEAIVATAMKLYRLRKSKNEIHSSD